MAVQVLEGAKRKVESYVKWEVCIEVIHMEQLHSSEMHDLLREPYKTLRISRSRWQTLLKMQSHLMLKRQA